MLMIQGRARAVLWTGGAVFVEGSLFQGYGVGSLHSEATAITYCIAWIR